MKFLSSVAVLSLFTALSAKADEDLPDVYGNADLVVKSVSFSKKSDEFGNGGWQFVSILVQNIGKQNVRSPSAKVNIKGVVFSASVYGPGQVQGQFLLGAPIFPGTVGQLLVYIPLNTIRHCERVAGFIDASHTLQHGYGNPFSNDTLSTVKAFDTQSIRPCIDRVIPREIPREISISHVDDTGF